MRINCSPVHNSIKFFLTLNSIFAKRKLENKLKFFTVFYYFFPQTNNNKKEVGFAKVEVEEKEEIKGRNENENDGK